MKLDNLQVSKLIGVGAGAFVLGVFASGVYLDGIKREFQKELDNTLELKQRLDNLTHQVMNGK
jgi:hypothetical protein